jgi:hypothetical protein
MGRNRSNNSVLDAIKAFGLTYGITKGLVDQSRAADAYAANTSVTENASGDESMKNFQSNYVPQEGGPATASEYLLQNPNVLSGMSPERKASYSMGGATQAEPFTDSQKIAAGQRGVQQYYAADGQADKASQLGLDASRARVGELAVNAGERNERKALSDEEALKKFHDIMKKMEDPKQAADYIIDAYSKNLGTYGEGEHKDRKIKFEPTKDGGGKAWAVDADGKAVTEPQVFTKEQIVKEAQSNFWRTTDPAGYAKAQEDQAARRALKEEDWANRVELAQIQGGIQSGLIDKRIAARTAGGGGGRPGAVGGDASKGAKFDVDSEGHRVILYRDGTMVYPKDKAGKDVKMKAGTDQDQKFTRDLVKVFAGKEMIPPENPVAKAEELTKKTRPAPAAASVPSGIPAGSTQIGTSGGKPVYQSPDGKRYIAD